MNRILTPARQDRYYREILHNSNLKLYYPLNELNGVVTNNKTPATRYTLNATLTVPPDLNLPGKFGKGFTFNGIDDYITSNSTNFFGGGFTIMGILNWAGVNAANTTQHIISKRDSFGASTMMWGLSLDKTNGYKFLFYGDGGAFPFWNYVPPIGTPIHWAVVYDLGNSVIRLYINGVQIGTIAIVTLGTGTAVNIRMGACETTPTEFFYGMQQHISIYNAVLKAEQIRRYANIAGFI